MSNNYAFSLGESSYDIGNDGKGCIKIRNKGDLSTISQPISFYYLNNRTKLQLGDGNKKQLTINSKDLEINLETEINNNLDICGNLSVIGDTTLDNSNNCILYVDGGVSQDNISKNIFLRAQESNNNINGGNIYLYAGGGTENDGIIEISGNIIPSQSEKYDIGHSNKNFRDFYLSENYLWLGNEINLSVNSDSNGLKSAGFNRRKKNDDGTFVIPDVAIGQGKTEQELNNMSLTQLTKFMREKSGNNDPWSIDLLDNFHNYPLVWENNSNNDIFLMNRKVGISTDNPIADLDISGSVNIEQDATVKGNLYLNNPIINSFEIISNNGIMDNSKSTCLILIENKQVDISMNIGVDGSTKHILYDDDNLNNTFANVNFPFNGLVTGGGYYSQLRFNHRGQSATLIFISGKWRIINTGAAVY